jgi:hypothetical protein
MLPGELPGSMETISSFLYCSLAKAMIGSLLPELSFRMP